MEAAMTEQQKHGILDNWGAKAAAVTTILTLVFLIFPRLQPMRDNGSDGRPGVTGQPRSPTTGEVTNPLPGDVILGTWRHSDSIPGDDRYLSTVIVTRTPSGYLMSVRDQAEDSTITNGIGIDHVECDGETWTFDSNWGKGEVGHFVLKRRSPTLFEGTVYENGKAIGGVQKMARVG
jgi:hypothetical protein